MFGNLDINTLLASAVVAALVYGMFTIANTLLNKKVKTPELERAEREEAAAERNRRIENLRTDLGDVRGDVDRLEKMNTALLDRLALQEDEIVALKRSELLKDYYIYRCIGVIQRLGTQEDVPRPAPAGIEI